MFYFVHVSYSLLFFMSNFLRHHSIKLLEILPHVATIYNANRNMLLALFNVSPDRNEDQNDTFQALFVITSFMIPSLHGLWCHFKM